MSVGPSDKISWSVHRDEHIKLYNEGNIVTLKFIRFSLFQIVQERQLLSGETNHALRVMDKLQVQFIVSKPKPLVLHHRSNGGDGDNNNNNNNNNNITIICRVPIYVSPL